MLELLRPFVQELHALVRPQPLYSVLATGGGVASVQWLFSTPGGSRSIKCAEIPYCRASLHEIAVKHSSVEMSSLCNEDAAVLLAKEAFDKTVHYAMRENYDDIRFRGAQVFGVGCTAALVSADGPKRGDHRCHIAFYSHAGVETTSVTLDKHFGRSREQEDALCSFHLLDGLRRHCGLTSMPSEVLCKLGGGTGGGDQLHQGHRRVESALVQAVAGKTPYCLLVPSADPMVGPLQWTPVDSAAAREHCLVFPGSFNPAHAGHVRLVRAALDGPARRARSVVFEIAAVNADKPEVALDALLPRLAQLATLQAEIGAQVLVAVTRMPLFAAKARVFPRSSFLIGADTLARVLDPNYYCLDGDPLSGEIGLVQALASLEAQGCDFVVGGRHLSSFKQSLDAEGDFVTLESLRACAPPVQKRLFRAFPRLFHGLGEEDFRLDLSSTEIRNQQRK